MKSKNSKFGLIFAIVCNAAIVLCFVVAIAIGFKVDLPNRINKDDFINYMENKGCAVIDIQEENYSGMDDYLVTDENTCPYLVSYATFNDSNKLVEFFSNGRKDVLKGNTNVTGSTSISINLSSEYYEYTTSGDYYKAIVYNDNSVLYASADKQYRDEVRSIFNDFHYKYEIDFRVVGIMWYSFLILLFICIVSMWGTEKKIRNKGWISLIPFYNIGCLSKDVLGSPWYALLLLLPIGNVLFIFKLYYNMGKAFGKDNLYCVLMMFFSSVLWPILAFDESTYTKPEKKITKAHNNPTIDIDATSVIAREDRIPKEQSNVVRKIIDSIKWLITIILLSFSALILITYFYEKLIGYLALATMLLIYGLMLCPSITKYTKRYKSYTKFKPLIVILLIIINFIIFQILPF